MANGQTGYRIGIDIGGTFTDFVLLDNASGAVRLAKTPSTPDALWRGIDEGLGQLGVDLAGASMLVHGTTIGLNCFLERKGAPTGLITTAGFRDVYEIGRVNREEMYDLFYQKPEPLVPREHRLEVRERLDARGDVLLPLHDDDVIAAAGRFRDAGIRSIAVCFLHAYANPDHEVRAGELLARFYPEALITLSHELVREWREYERTSTTAINAYIAQAVEGYLGQIEDRFRERGYDRPFFVNQSAGGVMSVAAAKGKPVQTIMSGPAGGAISAATVGARAGYPRVIAFDMGGTSTDVSLAVDGQVRVTAEAKLERHPVMVPMVDIRSIGAGGGSLAWLDPSGRLAVGPRSAGAEPGPACYGRGGAEPTVTDANLLLGRLQPRLLGGRMTLDEPAARDAITHRVAAPLGLDPVTAALGIVRIINSTMAYAIRAITVQRGLDPADFALLAFGGAGPMHGCEVAAELGISRVVVPVASGAFSALGMLLGDVRHDLVRTRLQPLDEADPALISSLLAELQTEATTLMHDELPPEAPLAFKRSLDIRYVGQEYTVKVPIPADTVTADDLPRLRADFDRRHEQAYGHASSTEQTEIINVRLTALGTLRPPDLRAIPTGSGEPPAGALLDHGETCFEHTAGFIPAPRYERTALLAGNRIPGPALISEDGATTVLTPGFTATVDPVGNLIIEREV